MSDRSALPKGQLDYAKAGVDMVREEEVLKNTLLKWVKKTLPFRQGTIGQVEESVGFFANVIDIGHSVGLALSTDGVGTKILVAQMMGKYDTVGIDCVAMNVNDIICVGAEPIAMLDYLAVENIDHPDVLDQIGKGIYEGAKMANIAIPGGETAQTADMIKAARAGHGFDLVGLAIGSVELDKIILGRNIEEGDVVIGLRASGIHSNGFTLARKILFDQMAFPVDQYEADLGRTVGEELLEPTRIYVPEVMDILRSGVEVKGLANITGLGFLNLTRLLSSASYVIDSLPEPHAIFKLIQSWGKLSDEEMFRVFNMGIGFCIITSESGAEKVAAVLESRGVEHYKIGHVVEDDAQKVFLEQHGLTGKGNSFEKS